MATLTVWTFNTPDGAENASRTLQELAGEELVVLHDAATVTWEPGTPKPRTRRLADTTVSGALGESFWGLLFGMIFFLPLLGAAIGAATGALAGSLSDVGIDDSFINKVRDEVTPGTSALFLLTSDPVPDQVHEAFAEHAPAQLLFTVLSHEQETALREVFAEQP
jgi:uncharacterized membrane protein